MSVKRIQAYSLTSREDKEIHGHGTIASANEDFDFGVNCFAEALSLVESVEDCRGVVLERLDTGGSCCCPMPLLFIPLVIPTPWLWWGDIFALKIWRSS